MELVKHNGADLDTNTTTTAQDSNEGTRAPDSNTNTTTTAQDSKPEPTPGKWTSFDVGPIQAKRIDTAARKLLRYGSAHVEITGTVGGAESRSILTSLFGPVTNPIPNRLYCAIGERCAWTVTGANAAALAAELEAAAAEALRTLPVQDKRRSQEEERKRLAENQARADAAAIERAERERKGAAILAKMPRGAVGAIVAESEDDVSDSMTDYFATKTTRRCIIGWTFSKRFSFDTCRKAAAAAGASTLPEVAHLGTKPETKPGREHPEDEHRENYSMGRGNYLKAGRHYSSGWIVRDRTYGLDAYGLGEFEDCIPPVRPLPSVTCSRDGFLAPRETNTTGPKLGEGSADGTPFVVRPGLREGFVEVAFESKPSADVIRRLKAAGFRWAVRSACWYGRALQQPLELAPAAARATEGGAS